jgi:ABC-type amino acid transport substrate-binding protein
MRKKRLFLCLSAVVLISFTLVISSSRRALCAESTLEKIMKSGKVKVGCVVSASTKKDPVTSEYTGYSPDAIRYIFSEIKVQPEFVDSTWATFAAGLQSGQFDLSILGTFADIARASAVLFTKPYIYLGTGVVASKSSNIRTLDDMKKPGVRVSLTQGTSQHRWAIENLPKAQYVISTALSEMRLLDVVAGKADIGLADSGITYNFVRAHPECINLFEDRPLDLMPICWSVRKGDYEFLHFMNNAVDVLHSTGRFKQLMVKNGVVPGTLFLPREVIEKFDGKAN